MVAVWLAPIYIMAERRGGEASTAFPFLSAEPIRSVYGFETCARLWFYLFHYSFIGLLRPGNNQVVVLWQSRGEGRGGGNTPSRSGLRLLPESNLFFGMRKAFHLQVRTSGSDTRTQSADTHEQGATCERGHPIYITLATCNTSVRCIFKWDIARNEKMTAIDRNRIFSLHFSYFICRPCTGCLHPAFAVDALILLPSAQLQLHLFFFFFFLSTLHTKSLV